MRDEDFGREQLAEALGAATKVQIELNPTAKQVRDYDRYLARRFLTRWQYAVWCVREWFR